MKQKKLLSLFLALTLSFSVLTGCGNTNDKDTQPTDAPAVTDTAADENKVAAEKLLKDLTGSYQELWPVILDSKYTQTWLDNCAALVGEENAQAAYDKLSSMVTGTVYGEEAVKAYANGGGLTTAPSPRD